MSLMSPEQCRAARGWLRWSRSDLAAKAAVPLNVIHDFESDRRLPVAVNLQAIRKAFHDAGLRLARRRGREAIEVLRPRP
jgi:ribosome-binding protein aMBF1 (putative translation factor)